MEEVKATQALAAAVRDLSDAYKEGTLSRADFVR
jgi:hypothetical protein